MAARLDAETRLSQGESVRQMTAMTNPPCLARPFRLTPTLTILCLSGMLLATTSQARHGTPPVSRQLKTRPLAGIAQVAVAATDPQAERAADARLGVTVPLRFAVESEIKAAPATHGTWETIPGGRLWRLRVVSEGATDLNFGFSICRLTPGATLHVYAEDEDYFQGPYEARDNKPHGQLWTPVLPGARAVIELFVPDGSKEQPELVLARVNRGYRDMFRRQKSGAAPKAGSCNIDVVCPIADPWRNEIRSVGNYSINGSLLCTGTLINDAPGDLKPFFLTANHCGIGAGNAASVVVYWNFESPACGQHGGGSLAQNQSGAIFRMAKSDVDVTLIELEEMPEPGFQVYYSGWDRSGVTPNGAVGIHHPNNDEKSISFASNALTTVNSCIGTGGLDTHWNVVWTSGVTEPGSSGSGIWDPDTHLLVGTLSGGGSACSTPFDADCYGKFSVAWSSGGTAATRLRDWLDPLNTGPASVPGLDPALISIVIGAGAALTAEGCPPGNGAIDPGESVTVAFALRNLGGSNTLNLVGTLLASNGVNSPSGPQTYGVLVSGGAAVTQHFSFTATGICGGSVVPMLQLQDGTNDLGTVTFNLPLGAPVLALAENFDVITAPALPAGWATSGSGAPLWKTITGIADTSAQSAYATNIDFISDLALTSPSTSITTTNAILSFRHFYQTEPAFDGGVLEISLTNGPFVDILAAGAVFLAGGYTAVLPTTYDNPLGTRQAWSGGSGGFVTSAVRLPSALAGQLVRFRWRLGTDDSVPSAGWWVDTVALVDGYQCCQAPPEIVQTHRDDADLVFSFSTAPGFSYVTEYKDLLATNVAWTPLQTNAGDGGLRSVTNAVGESAQRFFRVRREP